MAGRRRGSGRGVRGHTPRHLASGGRSGARSHRKSGSGNPFGGLFSSLRPSWTPPGGFPKPGAPGVFPGTHDAFSGTAIRFPSSTYRSRSAWVNQRFGFWT